MRLPPLIEGRLVRRYKRFLADVALADGSVITAHCPNPGAMTGLGLPGLAAWLSVSEARTRKLPHTLELVRVAGGLVGIHTGRPNGIVAEAIEAGAIPELAGYAGLRREVTYGGNSRVDILLEEDGRPPCYVEVKNVHLRRPDGAHPTAAEFPDSVTARGTKHLGALAAMVAGGARAVMVYLVQRGDCDHFRIAGDIDPTYEAALRHATAAGVETLCVACTVSTAAIEVDRPLPVVL